MTRRTTLQSDDSFSFEEVTLCDDISSRELTLPDAELTVLEIEMERTEEELYIDPTPRSCVPQPLIDEAAERDAAALRRIIAMGSRDR